MRYRSFFIGAGMHGADLHSMTNTVNAHTLLPSPTIRTVQHTNCAETSFAKNAELIQAEEFRTLALDGVRYLVLPITKVSIGLEDESSAS